MKHCVCLTHAVIRFVYQLTDKSDVFLKARFVASVGPIVTAAAAIIAEYVGECKRIGEN